MRSHSFVAAMVILLLVLTVNADDEANIRGPVSKVINEEEYTRALKNPT